MPSGGKRAGNDKPDFPKVMQAALERYLRSKSYLKSLIQAHQLLKSPRREPYQVQSSAKNFLVQINVMCVLTQHFWPTNKNKKKPYQVKWRTSPCMHHNCDTSELIFELFLKARQGGLSINQGWLSQKCLPQYLCPILCFKLYLKRQPKEIELVLSCSIFL